LISRAREQGKEEERKRKSTGNMSKKELIDCKNFSYLICTLRSYSSGCCGP
jgi:hypothetical protein